ncbi:MAG: response regulator transcription factor [Clostridiales bacterium]|nr:response regulator transcription factor [Clostridiales bacterium]
MRLLLVEDDEKLNHALAFQLRNEGFETDTCYDGEEALYYIRQRIHDLILLDWMLPCISGIEVLKTMREEHNQTPVILITALDALDDKVTGLDCGADDYLVKPFALEELLARLRCIARRPRKLVLDGQLSCGDMTYYIEENRLTGREGACSLSKREGALLETFFRNPAQTLPRSLLLTRVWGLDSDVEDGNLDNYIHFLRRRLRTVGSACSIQTVRGVGYRLQLS